MFKNIEDSLGGQTLKTLGLRCMELQEGDEEKRPKGNEREKCSLSGPMDAVS